MSMPPAPRQDGPGQVGSDATGHGHAGPGRAGRAGRGHADRGQAGGGRAGRGHADRGRAGGGRAGRGQRSGSQSRLVRAALLVYPPAWRARYGEEVVALADETGGGLRSAVSLVWHALPAWMWPPEHLHDREGRMRASLGTVLLAWSVLVGICLVFVQLTQFQGFRPAGHPIIGWCYAVIDAAVAVSALSAAAGGLPLWLLMLRRARREHLSRDMFYLLLPVIAPASFLAGLVLTTRLAPHPNGFSSLEFVGVTVAGFAAAGAACAGPILAMTRLRPRGPAVHLAARTAGVAAASIAVAAVASGIAAAGLSLWARDFAGYHQAGQVGCYVAVVVAGAAVACAGAVRGLRAALARSGR